MKYNISVLKSHYQTTAPIVKQISNFSVLKTRKNKRISPMWNMTKTLLRSDGPIEVSGFLIDYDSIEFPDEIKGGYELYYHQTHSGKYRIIVPFDKTYDFTDDRDWICNYKRMLREIILNATGKSLGWYEKNNILQPRTYVSTGSWFYMRHESVPLHHHIGKPFIPRFITSIGIGTKGFDYSYELDPKSIVNRSHQLPKKYFKTESEYEESEITRINRNKAILQRVNIFMSIYASVLDWKPLRNASVNNKCFFDWHVSGPSRDGSLQMNTMNIEEGYIPNFYCHHNSCLESLEKFIKPYNDLSEDEEKKGYKIIKNRTAKYLAALVIKGLVSMRMIELCGFYNDVEMVKRRKSLPNLNMNAEKDSNLWINLYHESIVLDRKSDMIYEYNDGVYTVTSKEALANDYFVSLGLYYHYKTNKESEKYIGRLLTYGKGHMQKKFDKLSHEDALNVNNGIITFSKGEYRFDDHNKQIFTTRKLPYDYDPDAKCDLWRKTLEDYFGKNSKQEKLLQQYFGYCLTYDRGLEKLLILYGASRGGKNTIVETLMHMVPSTDGDLKYLTNMERKSTMLCDSKVVFFNEVDHLNCSETVNELKRLSSTGSIMIRYLKKDSVPLNDIPKIIIAFNNPPDGMNFDKALKNRMLSIKFHRTFEGRENVNLKDELLTELPGILNWSLEGYLQLYGGCKKFIDYRIDSDALYGLANIDKSELCEFLYTLKDEKDTWRGPELKNKYMQLGIGDSRTSSQKFYSMLDEVGCQRTMGRKGINIHIPELLNKLGS